MWRLDGLLIALEPLRRHLAVWRSAWQMEKLRPKLAGRNSDELAFLPSVIEIVETPASPLGRATSYAIMILVAVTIIWASIGQVDIHATAQGRIITGGKTKPVAPTESASVAAIYVNDGDHVKQGQVLIDLDPTAPKSDADQYHGEWLEQIATAATLRTFLAAQDQLKFDPALNVPESLLRVHQAQLSQKQADLRSTVEALRHEQEQKEADAKGAETQIARLTQTIPVLQERAKARQEASEGGFGSRDDYLSIQQDLIESQHQLDAARFTLRDDEAAIANVQERLKESVAKFRADALTQLADADQKAASLKQQMMKAEERATLFRLTAPVDGVVQQMTVHAPGAVVSQAQPVLMVVPDDEGIAIEAALQNQDVGFVHPGQAVEIKIESFPFTHYGTIPGEVEFVSSDAMQTQSNDPAQNISGRSSQANNNSSASSQSQGPVYSVRIKPLKNQIQVDDREELLTPGMAVTAEIKTGKRRVIDYILDPVSRYWGESLRER